MIQSLWESIGYRTFYVASQRFKSIYIPPIDKERAMAQEPEILCGRFKLYESIKRQYQVKDKDVYNIDEKGFIQGVVAKLRVIISKHERKTAMTQYGNREWVSLVECISIDRRILKPWVIFKAKQQQKAWYEVLEEGHIATSKKGWIDNELSLTWLEWCFAKETAVDQKGEYRTLILDRHASRAIVIARCKIDCGCQKKMRHPSRDILWFRLWQVF